jgi:hypothetical protein
MKKNKVLVLTQTSLLLAMLVAVQFLTHSFGQFITGSLVNLILLTATFIVGLDGGLIIGIASPFLASLLGVGPAIIQIVFFVAIANALFVMTAWYLTNKSINSEKKGFVSGFSLTVAALVKTAFLWVGLVKIALPLIPGLNQNQIAVISTSFTWPQLITALIGSALTLVIVPILHKLAKR